MSLQDQFAVMQKFKDELLKRWTRKRAMTILEFRLLVMDAQQEVINQLLQEIKDGSTSRSTRTV